MWKFLGDLYNGMPPLLFYSLIVLGLITIVIIALRGHIKASFGKKTIEIGSDSHDNSENASIKPPPTVTIIQKRTCGDCILMLMGEREKFELKIRKESDRILKNQMNFVEQKLIEIQNSFMGMVIDVIHDFIKNNTGSIDESIQYKLIYGLLKDALMSIKDELRRSFKDNGFYEVSESEFLTYTRDHSNVIMSMLNQHITNILPNKPGILSPNDLSEIIKNQSNFLSNVIDDIYIHAREIKIDADNKIDQLQLDFGKWVDEFIKPSMKEELL